MTYNHNLIVWLDGSASHCKCTDNSAVVKFEGMMQGKNSLPLLPKHTVRDYYLKF